MGSSLPLSQLYTSILNFLLLQMYKLLLFPSNSSSLWCGLFTVFWFSGRSFRKLWFKTLLGTSLVAQWLRICLPVQGTGVRALVREDPTRHRAAKPVCHNYWACAVEPTSHNYWSPCATTTEARAPRAPCSATREATAMRSLCTAKSSPRSPQLEKARTQQGRPNTAINK